MSETVISTQTALLLRFTELVNACAIVSNVAERRLLHDRVCECFSAINASMENLDRLELLPSAGERSALESAHKLALASMSTLFEKTLIP